MGFARRVYPTFTQIYNDRSGGAPRTIFPTLRRFDRAECPALGQSTRTNQCVPFIQIARRDAGSTPSRQTLTRHLYTPDRCGAYNTVKPNKAFEQGSKLGLAHAVEMPPASVCLFLPGDSSRRLMPGGQRGKCLS